MAKRTSVTKKLYYFLSIFLQMYTSTRFNLVLKCLCSVTNGELVLKLFCLITIDLALFTNKLSCQMNNVVNPH